MSLTDAFAAERAARAAYRAAVERARERVELATSARDAAHAAYTLALTVHETVDTNPAWNTLLLTNEVLRVAQADHIAAIVAPQSW